MNSHRLVWTIAFASLAWLLLLKVAEAQVTFSRDWNAGKRWLSLPECAAPLKAASNLCHLMINELKSMTNCELKAILANRVDDSDPGDSFLAQRSG